MSIDILPLGRIAIFFLARVHDSDKHRISTVRQAVFGYVCNIIWDPVKAREDYLMCVPVTS
jgi:hypothetical protein